MKGVKPTGRMTGGASASERPGASDDVILEADLRRIERMVCDRVESTVAELRGSVVRLEARVGDLESVFDAQWGVLRRIELEGLAIRQQVCSKFEGEGNGVDR